MLASPETSGRLLTGMVHVVGERHRLLDCVAAAPTAHKLRGLCRAGSRNSSRITAQMSQARRVGGSKRPRDDPAPSAGAAHISDASHRAKLARCSGGSRADVAGAHTAPAPAAPAGTDR